MALSRRPVGRQSYKKKKNYYAAAANFFFFFFQYRFSIRRMESWILNITTAAATANNNNNNVAGLATAEAFLFCKLGSYSVLFCCCFFFPSVEQRKLLLIAWNVRPTSCPTSRYRAPGAQVHSNGFRWRGSFCYVCLIISDDVKSGLFMAKTWRVLGLKNQTQQTPNLNVCKAWILRGFCSLMWSNSLVQWPWTRWGRHLTGQAGPKAPNRPADSVGKNCRKRNVAKRGQT